MLGLKEWNLLLRELEPIGESVSVIDPVDLLHQLTETFKLPAVMESLSCLHFFFYIPGATIHAIIRVAGFFYHSKTFQKNYLLFSWSTVTIALLTTFYFPALLGQVRISYI